MKRLIGLTLCLLMVLLTGCQPAATVDVPTDNTYAVLMEMDSYPDGYSDLDVDYVNTGQLQSLFLDLGVPEDHIYLWEDAIALDDLLDAITWIDTEVPEDATVFFYLAAHGTYIRNELAWSSFVPKKWNALPQRDKILVIDACMSGEFVEPFADAQTSGLVYGVTAPDELDWWGIEEEGLPIIGSIWVHYFAQACMEPEADTDGDGAISFMEAHEYANPLIQQYMADEVFAVDAFLSGYQRSGFDPMRKDGYPNPFYYNHLTEPVLLGNVQ